jgi:rhodanese-related sulfurtransferase
MQISRRIFLLLLLAIVWPCFADQIDLSKRESLTPKEAASLQQEVIFLDVRSTLEWLWGHVEGAVHMPYKKVPQDFAAEFPDRSIPVIPYCAVGVRAQYVVDALRQQGYTVVPVIDGGYRELIANGMKKD